MQRVSGFRRPREAFRGLISSCFLRYLVVFGPWFRRFLTLLFLLSTSPRIEAGSPQLLSVQKIWDQGSHNAFTDLIRFQNKWLCIFREGETHAGGDDGKIRVIESDDGDQWVSAALISEQGIDLRDPKLSVTPQGRLMMVAGGSLYEDNVYRTRAPRVAFSADGLNWSQPQRVLAEDHWLWRVTWYQDTAYSVSKLNDGKEPRRVMLYSSKDGLDWSWVTEFKGIPGWPNEATLRVLLGGEMICLLRRNQTGSIGRSRPPYKTWTWTDTEYRLGGPNFIQTPNGELWAGSRDYSRDEVRTVLARMTPFSYEPVLTLPSGGDTSYPGLRWHEGQLWMSYYSSHEGKTSIYLAKIQMQR